MITFFIAIAVLLLGYLIYGKFVEKVFGIDPQRATPATTMADGVDYVPMKPWRIFLIQFLNIAGVGPIIGAIMGAQFGTASFLWIVFGSIFAGAVHDYLSGMISLRDKGASLHEGTRRGTARNGLQHRRFHLQIAALVEETADAVDDAGAGDEDVLHAVVHHEIDVTHTVAQFGVVEFVVFHAVLLLDDGQRPQRLAQHRQFLDMHRDFAHLRAEGETFHADEVADVQKDPNQYTLR